MKENKKHSSKNNIISVIIVIICILCIVAYKYFQKGYTTYTVENGNIENYSETQACIIKDENIVESKNNDTIVPVVAQDQRVSKDEIIATYQSSKYSEDKEKIEAIDKQIEEAVNDISSSVYSTDITQIASEIQSKVSEAKGINSYVKMQEYKNKLDELANKKIVVIGNLAPKESTIKDLISQRGIYEQESKKNTESIKATTDGLVTYKIDNLENVADISKILNYSTSDFNNIFNKYIIKDNNNFGVKIVDNYLAYLIVKEPKGINDKYIIEGLSYDITLLDQQNYVLTAILSKKIETSDTYYCVFKITNGIENLVDIRKTDVKVSWYSVTGMMIPKKDLIKVNDVYYVKIIKDGDYVDVPVKIKIESDNMCVVTNYKDTDKIALNLSCDYNLSLYDRVVE